MSTRLHAHYDAKKLRIKLHVIEKIVVQNSTIQKQLFHSREMMYTVDGLLISVVLNLFFSSNSTKNLV